MCVCENAIRHHSHCISSEEIVPGANKVFMLQSGHAALIVPKGKKTFEKDLVILSKLQK